jgi:aminomethyltransferase
MVDPQPTGGTEGRGLRHTALHGWHRAAGAKLADFGGWEMPIEYPGGGVLREHEAVRERVGVFDVSHLGKVEVRGRGAAELIDACLTNALERIGPGRAQYTLCCDEAAGGVVDDLIVYLRGGDDVLLVPNAANAAEVAARLAAEAPPEVSLTDRHDDLCVLAVQGPRSPEVMAEVGLPTGLEYMAFARESWRGGDVTICRTGYTGELGYELIVDSGVAEALWETVIAATTAAGGLPCGLGARDTLRTEMGYPLHGNDLSLQISPVQARLGWAVGWRKPRFWGRSALLAEREQGPRRLARGLLALERGVPRPHLEVLGADGRAVGTTTSGTFSPTLRQGIALALLDAGVTVGEQVEVDVRGRRLPCRVVDPPFVPSHVRSA